MTIKDINDIINAVCPNDEDYEKPCISPKYLRQELEQLALDQEQKYLEQEPILDKINKMKSEIADSLEFWDYSPNNNPLARDMLETLTNFLGDIKVESER
jgi:hypothetical protein